MANLHPFHAIQYNLEKAKNLNNIIAPPYDQISEKMQDELYNRDPHNFVRLIFGKTSPDDTERNNRYTRAADLLQSWSNEKTLLQEEVPSFFAYEQNFSVRNGVSYTRLGLVGLMRLDPLGKGVLPHEQTFAKPKADRLSLMKACKSNFEHVFFLYDDSKNYVREALGKLRLQSPSLHAQDDLGTKHSLWPVTDPALIQQLQTFFHNKQLLIADGHHRYETSLTYEQEMDQIYCDSTSASAPYHYRLGTFVSLQDPGLIILPTHRVLKSLSTSQLETLEAKLPEYFTIQEVPTLELLLQRMKEGKHTFGWGMTNRFRLLTLKETFDPSKEFSGSARALQSLDVFILHKLIFDKLLHLDHDKLDQLISYVRWPEDAYAMVKSGSHQSVFLLNATKPEEVNAIARSGEKMPHKSTDFYPKLWSGLLFYKMNF